MAIFLNPSTRDISIKITNKTEGTIKVLWDEASYIDKDKIAHRIMHKGVKYIDRDRPQPPTAIPSGTAIIDFVVPSDYAVYISGQFGGWSTKALFPEIDVQENNRPVHYKNTYFGIVIPLEINNVTELYRFKFKIIDVSLKSE